jgi:hypothetical protein
MARCGVAWRGLPWSALAWSGLAWRGVATIMEVKEVPIVLILIPLLQFVVGPFDSSGTPPPQPVAWTTTPATAASSPSRGGQPSKCCGHVTDPRNGGPDK